MFHTSVAVTGQFTAATAITWARSPRSSLGPVSEYLRQTPHAAHVGLMLMVLGTLVVRPSPGTLGPCWPFGVWTGVGAAMTPPNRLATIADVFPGTARQGDGLGDQCHRARDGVWRAAGSHPERSRGWRVPFYVIGALLLLLWGLLWGYLGFPRASPGHTGSLCHALPGGGRQGRLVVCPGSQLSCRLRPLWGCPAISPPI